MTEKFITKPFGLEEFTDVIEANCFKADIYSLLGYRHDHYIVNLSRHNGRTTLLRYMAQMYKAWQVCSFENSPGENIEFVLDGTYSQMESTFAKISRRAEGGRHFDGIVGLDITQLAWQGAKPAGRQLSDRFAEHCRKKGQHCYFVFFTQTVMDRREQLFCNRLQSRVPDVKQLYISPYTAEDFAHIMEKSFADRGIITEDYKDFHPVLREFAADCGIGTVPEALQLAKQIAQFADFDGILPRVRAESIEQLADSWGRNALG